MRRKFHSKIAPLIPLYNASYLEGNQLSGILLIASQLFKSYHPEKGFSNLIALRVLFLLYFAI